MDLDSLTAELQIRGFDQNRIDTALRCLVHVFEVQDHTSKEKGGVLVEDVLNTYPLEITTAASELFLERLSSFGRDVFRVRWGFENAARRLERQLWENGSDRWREFIQGFDDRYLGFFLPRSFEDARIISSWKARKDLKWFGVEVPTAGWNILRMIDDLASVSSTLDLAFVFRRFDEKGILGERTLIHRKAFEALKEKASVPPESVRSCINIWRFFSEYDPNSTDIVQLMKECEVSLEEVQGKIAIFHGKGITTPYREGQYPPFLVLDKMKERYREEVKAILFPMEGWLMRKGEATDGRQGEDAKVDSLPMATPPGRT